MTALRPALAADFAVLLGVAVLGTGALRPHETLELVGQFGGTLSGLAADARHIYLVEGDRLVVLEHSWAGLPTVVGRSERLPGTNHRVAIDGDLVYVVAGMPFGRSSWLYVLDLRAPTQPTLVAELARPPPEASGEVHAWDVAVADGLLLVATGSAGLRVVDVRDPLRPREAGSLIVPEQVTSVAAAGSTAYVTVSRTGSAPGFVAVDVADPTHPRELVRMQLERDARSVTLWAGYALVASEVGLLVLEVADPRRLREVGRLTLESGLDEVTGIAILDGDRAVLEVSELIPIGLRSHLTVVDLAEPTAPRVLSEGEAHVSFGTLAAVGDRVFVVAGPQGLFGPGGIWAFEVDAAGAMHELEQAWALASAKAVAVDAGYTYVLDWYGGISILDVTVPERPTQVGRLSTPMQVSDIVVVGDVAYVAHAGARFEPWGVQIVDVADPRQPVEKGFAFIDSLSGTPGPMSLAVSGDHAFVTGGDTERLWVLDVSDPASATEVAALDTGGPALGLDVADDGRSVYLATGEAGLLVADVAARTAPREIARVPFDDWASDVALVAGHAYVATLEGGLRVLDVADPRAPREVAVLPDVRAGTLEPHRDFLVASSASEASESAGDLVWLIDATDPVRPRVAGTMGLADARDVAMWGDLVAAAGSRFGLYLARTTLGVPLPARTLAPTRVPSPTAVPTPMPPRLFLPSVVAAR